MTPARSLRPATRQQDWLTEALEAELALRKKEVAATVRRSPAVVAALENLANLRTAFLAEIRTAQAPSDEDEDEKEDGASSGARPDLYPALSMLSHLVAAGELDEPSLQRVPLVFRSSLDAALRETWCAASPPAIRSHAVTLAQALATLQAWTFR